MNLLLRRGACSLAAVVLLATLCASGAGAAGAAPTPPGDLSAPAARSIHGAPGARGDKLTTQMRRVSSGTVDPSVPRDGAGNVDVLVHGADTAAIEQAVTDSGGTVKGSIPGKVDAFITPDRLDALASHPAVTQVSNGREYDKTAGTVTSEGVHNTNADAWQNAIPNNLGAGVNVAIVDVGGFQGYSGELGDELPASVNKKNYCGSNPDVFDSTFTGDPHGTEVAAIVHDMAPSAGITLICAMNDSQIAQAKDYILANNIQIAVGSFGSPVQGRGDGSSPWPGSVEDSVRQLRQGGVLWVSSAGNDADVHYAFTPAGPDQQSPVGPEVAWAPNNYEDGFSVPPFSTVNFLVKWDAWTGPAQDFDLYIVDINGNLVGDPKSNPSVNDQTHGAPPVEGVPVTNPTSNWVTYYAVITRYAAFANPRFDTYVQYAASELVNAAGSIDLPGDSPYAFTAGATCVSTNALEPYSSQGPTIDGRIKPDITGPDGTSGQVSGSTDPYGAANSNCTSGFTGTSASAPHVAGAAALVKGANPSFTAQQVQDFLTCRATDAGAAGPDPAFGNGRLNLGPVPGPVSPNIMKPAVIRNGMIFEKNTACTGPADIAFQYGDPGDQIIMCDWDGNGTRTPAVFRNGLWYLRNASGSGYSDVPVFQLGDPGDIPVCGHWDASSGNGPSAPIDTVGVFRRGVFYLKFHNATGYADTFFSYGNTTDIPVAGDWDNDGITTVGVYRAGTWFLRNNTGGGYSDIPPVGYGDPGDLPVVGDWNGDGSVTMGVFRGGLWLLRDDNVGGYSTRPSFLFGSPGDKPQAWR